MVLGKATRDYMFPLLSILTLFQVSMHGRVYIIEYSAGKYAIWILSTPDEHFVHTDLSHGEVSDRKHVIKRTND